MEQERLTIPEHLSSPPVFNEVRVTRSLVLCVCVVDRCLSFCPFSFGNRVVCSFSIYGFWLPLWYLQTLLNSYIYLSLLRNWERIVYLASQTWLETYVYIAVLCLSSNTNYLTSMCFSQTTWILNIISNRLLKSQSSSKFY